MKFKGILAMTADHYAGTIIDPDQKDRVFLETEYGWAEMIKSSNGRDNMRVARFGAEPGDVSTSMSKYDFAVNHLRKLVSKVVLLDVGSAVVQEAAPPLPKAAKFGATIPRHRNTEV